MALAPSPPAWADDDAIGGVDAASSVAAAAAAAASESSEPEVVEFAFDDVEIGAAPDVAAQKARQTDLRARGLTELEAKAIENNQKIKQYNNAPDEFPTFVREGYDVKVITAPGFVTQDDGLVYKDFVEGTGAVPVDGQEVTFEYVAYNENGGTIDSTYRKGQPASTRLGINGMIPGFEEGLKGMREGEEEGRRPAGARATDGPGDVLLREAVGGVRHRARQDKKLPEGAELIHVLQRRVRVTRATKTGSAETNRVETNRGVRGVRIVRVSRL